MFSVSDEEFQTMVDTGIASLPSDHRKAIKNVAFFVRDTPSEDQASRAGLQPGQLLLGLYDGVPLSRRQGQTGFMPDRITIFKHSIELICASHEAVAEQVRHTIWHEVAHYFGLNHDDIHNLEPEDLV